RRGALPRHRPRPPGRRGRAGGDQVGPAGEDAQFRRPRVRGRGGDGAAKGGPPLGSRPQGPAADGQRRHGAVGQHLSGAPAFVVVVLQPVDFAPLLPAAQGRAGDEEKQQGQCRLDTAPAEHDPSHGGRGGCSAQGEGACPVSRNRDQGRSRQAPKQTGARHHQRSRPVTSDRVPRAASAVGVRPAASPTARRAVALSAAYSGSLKYWLPTAPVRPADLVYRFAAYGSCDGSLKKKKQSCAMRKPAYSGRGTCPEFLSSKVNAPLKPGSTKPAVACTSRPRRPHVLRPSRRAAMSLGRRMNSNVLARANSPGCSTKGSPGCVTMFSV